MAPPPKGDDNAKRVDLFRRHRELLLVNYRDFAVELRALAVAVRMDVLLPPQSAPAMRYSHKIPTNARPSDNEQRILFEDRWKVSLFDFIDPKTKKRVLAFKDEHFAEGIRVLPIETSFKVAKGERTLEDLLERLVSKRQVKENALARMNAVPPNNPHVRDWIEPRGRTSEHFFVVIVDKRDSKTAITQQLIPILYRRRKGEATRSVIDEPYQLDWEPPHERDFAVEDPIAVFYSSRGETDFSKIAADAYPALAERVGRPSNAQKKTRLPKSLDSNIWKATVAGIRRRCKTLSKALRPRPLRRPSET